MSKWMRSGATLSPVRIGGGGCERTLLAPAPSALLRSLSVAMAGVTLVSSGAALGATVTAAGATNVNPYGEGALTASAAQNSIVSIDRDGDTNTVRATHAPASTITIFSQHAIQGLQQATQPNVLPPPSVAGDSEAVDHGSKSGDKANAAGVNVATPGPVRPDERPLWRLLQDGQLARLDTEIAVMSRTFPTWSPPAAMRDERARQLRERAIQQALAGDLPLLKQLIAQSPDAFGCEHVDRAWRAADLLAHAEHASANDTIYLLYSQIVPNCASDVNRIATLQRSVDTLAPAQVKTLMAAEQAHGVRGAAAQRGFTRLQDTLALDAVDRASGVSADPAAIQHALNALAAPVRASEDGAAATRAGWIAYSHHLLNDAADWFSLAITYAANANVGPNASVAGRAKSTSASMASEATLGLVQVRIEQGHSDVAERLLQGLHSDDDARVRALHVQIALLHAGDAYGRKQYVSSLTFLDQAVGFGASPEQVEVMQGWSLYGSGDYQRAEAVFDRRYRRLHDDDSAEGLALSRQAVEKYAHTQAKTHVTDAQTAEGAPEQSGPLPGYIAALKAQQLYYQKQFLAANVQWRIAQASDVSQQRLAHYMPGDLTGIDAADITTGLSWSDHVGTKGDGRLTTLTPTIEAGWYDKTRAYDLQYKQHILSTGAKTVNAEQLQFSVADSVPLTDGRLLDVYGSAGATQGGEAGFTPQGKLAIGQHAASHAWSTYIASAPVRDSLLSWRGETRTTTTDTTQSWGSVTRQMAGGSGNWQFAPHWTASAGGDVEWLTGQHVLGNEGAKADAAVSYDVGLPGFDYVSVGPAVHYLAYRRNENFYVPQQGGYYSPQLSTSAGVMLQLLSIEGAKWQWSSSLELGWNYTRQTGGDCQTPDVAAGKCDGGDNRGMYGHVQFSGVKRLAAQWQLGALVDVNVTPGRDKQIAALAFLRYFLSPRNAVYSRDLPNGVQAFHATDAR